MDYDALVAPPTRFEFEGNDECYPSVWDCLCPSIVLADRIPEHEYSGVRREAYSLVREGCRGALKSLRTTDSIIYQTSFNHFTDLRHDRTESTEWYKDEVAWYNGNRRQILKALDSLLGVYQDIINEDTLETTIKNEFVPEIKSIQRDLKAWTRTRTEQAQCERNLQRAFKYRKPGRPRVTGRPSDSEYTGVSGADTTD